MADRTPTPPPATRPPTAGFTLVEVMVTLAILALLFALIVPNLEMLVPSARLRSSGKQILHELDWVRSEARIQGKRMAMEFDLDRAIWRIVYPPEQQLTRDQDASTLEERPDIWIALQDDVVFAGAGDGKAGLAAHGLYRLQFDEYGFTGDQVLTLALQSDPKMTWTLTILGLSGRVTVEESEVGEKVVLATAAEGAF
ncbi:MAG: prepilin-type N-terminal cleavage/methylation domain-containing protein [Planctomycetota bacterium]